MAAGALKGSCGKPITKDEVWICTLIIASFLLVISVLKFALLISYTRKYYTKAGNRFLVYKSHRKVNITQ